MAITRAQQVRQMLEEGGILVSPSKDGKRPGYRNPTKERQKAEKAAQKSKDRANLREQASVAATQGRRTPTMKEVREIVNRGPDDRSSDLQTFNTYQQTGRYNPELEDMFQEDKKIFNPVEDLNLNEREKQFQKFLKFRKPVKFPNYSVFKPFENVAQKFSNFNASINRPFFEKVIRAGKIPGLSFDMTEEELEDAYQDYMSNRLSGVTDAYGNLKTGFMRTADGQIIKTGRDDDPILFPEGTTPGDPNQDPDDGDDDDNTQTGSGLALRFMNRGGSPMDAPTQGGIMMASGVLGDESDDISEEMFGKPVKDLNPSEFQELMDYLDSLDKKFSSKKGITQMASAPDPMDTRNDMMQNIAIEYFGKPLKDLTEDEIIQIEEMMDEMTKKQTSSRVMAQEGGIMDLETGRQMYFLGKLVKKATRAVKKIAKSPLGKAAILGGAAYFAGQGGGLGALLKKAAVGAPTDLVTGKRAFSGLFGTGGEFNLKAGLLGQNPFLTFGGLAAILPFLTEEEQQQLISSRGVSIDPGYIRDNPTTFASQVGSGSGIARAFSADGGRIGLKDGKTPSFEEYMQGRDKFEKQMNIEKKYREYLEQMRRDKVAEQKTMAADGGRIGYQEGSKEPVAKKTMPLLDMGGKEMDLRDDGGFVPIGRMEKADDVPARLSKNEFVFTADAVRNAGEGDVDKGAEVMYNMMKNLESGGQVSEESQGLEGAREMFQTSKRLEEVL